MKKAIASICLSLLLTSTAVAASSKDDLQSRIDSAKVVLDQIMAAKDQTIPSNILRSATCVAVVPGMVKGAFLVGAQYGQGVVTCRTGHGWSAPVFIRMAGGSFGFQIGGQATDLILIAVNDRGMQDLLKDKFKIGGDASAAAGPVGRARRCLDGLEDERGTPQLLARQGALRRHRPRRHQREPEQGGHGTLLRRSRALRYGSKGRRSCSARRGRRLFAMWRSTL